MKVVIIGTGNVATVLCKLITISDHILIEVAGRNTNSGKTLAATYSIPYTVLDQINPTADLYIISVSDRAVEQVVAKALLPADKIIVHTTGSLSADVLKTISKRYGILYPLQSIRKEMVELPEIPWLVDANDEETRGLIHKFAKSLSDRVAFTNDTDRRKLHVAAVFVSNFTNYLYSLGDDFCKEESLDFNLLFPLIKETALRTLHHHPWETMTGPAVRGDDITLQSHLEVLRKHPPLQLIYNFLTKNIQDKLKVD